MFLPSNYRGEMGVFVHMVFIENENMETNLFPRSLVLGAVFLPFQTAASASSHHVPSDPMGTADNAASHTEPRGFAGWKASPLSRKQHPIALATGTAPTGWHRSRLWRAALRLVCGETGCPARSVQGWLLPDLRLPVRPWLDPCRDAGGPLLGPGRVPGLARITPATEGRCGPAPSRGRRWRPLPWRISSRKADVTRTSRSRPSTPHNACSRWALQVWARLSIGQPVDWHGEGQSGASVLSL